jgi:3-phosphoshikimate 1-carboxyvinyltransferase
MLTIESMELHGPIDWALPPSKSHMIRWLALAAQAEGETVLSFDGEPGEDILSMAKCLQQLGAGIDRSASQWSVTGVGAGGFSEPEGVLDCGNSGTAVRFLTAIAAGIEPEVILDGDTSLRRRDLSALNSALRELGCEISSDAVPLSVKGLIGIGGTYLDMRSSSQPLSALLLASPGYSGPLHLGLSEGSVSRGYSRLSFELAELCGSPNRLDSDILVIEPWRVSAPATVGIPDETSLLPMAMLMSELHCVEVEVRGWDNELTPALMALSEQASELDLRDESDVITPAAALLALVRGGRITGAAHSRGKESDRILKTVEMLAAFGMASNATDDGIEIPGGQVPARPESPVETHGDHRIAMTAMVLASKVGGTIVNPEISAVTDPGFIERLTGLER